MVGWLKRHRVICSGVGAGVGVALLFLFGMANPDATLLSVVEQRYVDGLLRGRAPAATSGEVVIAAVDAKAIDRYGRWPWSRARFAELLDALTTHYKARLIGFDIVFSEAGDADALALLADLERELPGLPGMSAQGSRAVRSRLTQLQGRYQGDEQLAKALRENGQAVLGAFLYAERNQAAHIPEAERARGVALLEPARVRVEPPRLSRGRVPGGLAPEVALAPFQQAARSAGLINVVPDPADGSIRRLNLVYQLGNQLYAALALELYRLQQGASEAVAEIDANGLVKAIRVGDRHIATDADGSIGLNYRGGPRTFPHLSVADLIERTLPVAQVAGKVVLVGVTDVGLGDLRVTPVSTVFPGVEIHATALDNLMTGSYLRHSLRTDLLSAGLILLASVALPLVVRVASLTWGALLWLGVLLGYGLLHRHLVLSQASWPSLSYVLLAIFAAGAASLVVKLAQRER